MDPGGLPSRVPAQIPCVYGVREHLTDEAQLVGHDLLPGGLSSAFRNELEMNVPETCRTSPPNWQTPRAVWSHNLRRPSGRHKAYTAPASLRQRSGTASG